MGSAPHLLGHLLHLVPLSCLSASQSLFPPGDAADNTTGKSSGVGRLPYNREKDERLSARGPGDHQATAVRECEPWWGQQEWLGQVGGDTCISQLGLLKQSTTNGVA